MKKMCYLLTMGLLAGSLTVPVFAASDADSASDKKWVIATDTVFKPFEYTDDDGNFVGIDVDVLDAEVSGSSFCFSRSASVFTVTLLLSTLYHFPLL